jgi:hypothetical protein
VAGSSTASIVDLGAKVPSAEASLLATRASSSTIKMEPASDSELIGTIAIKQEPRSDVKLVGITTIKNEPESDFELISLPQPTINSDSESDVFRGPIKPVPTSVVVMIDSDTDSDHAVIQCASTSVEVKSEPGAPFTPPKPRPNFATSCSTGKKRKATATGYGSPLLISSDSKLEAKPVPVAPAGHIRKKKISASSSVISISSDFDEPSKRPIKPAKPAKPTPPKKVKRSSSVISISSGSDDPSKFSTSAHPCGAPAVKQETKNESITIVITDSNSDSKPLHRKKKSTPSKEGIQITRQLVVDELKTLTAFPSSYDIPEDGCTIAYQIILKDSEEEYSKAKDRQGETLTMVSCFRQSVSGYIFSSWAQTNSSILRSKGCGVVDQQALTKTRKCPSFWCGT